MIDLKDEFLAFISKAGMMLFYIFLGIVGKISVNLMTNKKMSLLQSLGEAGAALFIGGWAAIFCYHRHVEASYLIVPGVTYLSGKIAMAIMTISVKEIKEYVMYMLKRK